MMNGRVAKMITIGGAALFLVVICITVIGVLLVPEQPARPMRATVIGVIYSIQSRLSIRAIVQFKGDDGRTGSASFFPNELACRVGDRVNAEEVGINLRLRPPACRHVPRSPWVR